MSWSSLISLLRSLLSSLWNKIISWEAYYEVWSLNEDKCMMNVYFEV